MDGTPVSLSTSGGTKATGIDPIFLSVRDTARALSLSTKQVYRLLDAGDIEDAYQGRKRLAVVDSVRAYAAKLRDETPTRQRAPKVA